MLILEKDIVPEYIENIHEKTAFRQRDDSKALIGDDKPYDAYKKDIAVIHIYFGQPTYIGNF